MGNPPQGKDVVANQIIGNTNTINVKDSKLTVQDDADTTKRLQFELSGVGIGSTRVVTIQNANITMESTAGAQSKVDTHVNDTSGAHAASAISNTPAGAIVATDVQAAITELDTEKVPTTRTVNLLPLSSDITLTLASIHFANQGGTARVLHGNATGSPSWSQIATNDITDANVTYIKIQEVTATDKILGRSSDGAGVVEEIPCTSVGRSIIDDATMGTVRTTLGLVASGAGDIWVEKAGDTMTGALSITSADVANVTALSVIQQDTSTSGAAFISNSSTGDGLFIGQSGNGVALHIDNNGAANSLTIEGTTANDLVVLKTGNVGIGAENPAQKLTIRNGVDGYKALGLYTISENAAARSWGIYYDNPAYGNFSIQVSDAYNTDPSLVKLMIGSAGNVGIGTVNPGAYKLNVAGDIYALGTISALTFVDRTPFYTGDALTELKAVKGTVRHTLCGSHSINEIVIDHKSLPPFAQTMGSISGRDIGAMISILTKAVQQLTIKVEVLEKKE